MILLIDNYDSFAYNLYQYLGESNPDIMVVRNDELTVPEVLALSPQRIVISPGPGRPSDAGICEELIRQVESAETPVPLLGVCLGHQAICEAFGGRIGYAKAVLHGKAAVMETVNHCALFAGLPLKFKVARYHSLAVEADALPEQLQVTGLADDGEIMAVQHVSAPIYGVQFHPESILTENGKQIIDNFVKGV